MKEFHAHAVHVAESPVFLRVGRPNRRTDSDRMRLGVTHTDFRNPEIFRMKP